MVTCRARTECGEGGKKLLVFNYKPFSTILLLKTICMCLCGFSSDNKVYLQIVSPVDIVKSLISGPDPVRLQSSKPAVGLRNLNFSLELPEIWS